MKISFVLGDGSVRQIEAAPGMSLMQVAQRNDIPGITADCGGACACATCHVHIAAEWAERIGAPDAVEADLLEMVDDCTPQSRLSCQIMMTPDLEGLTVCVPSG